MTDWDEHEHPRHPPGSSRGGRFRRTLATLDIGAYRADERWAVRLSRQIDDGGYRPGQWTREHPTDYLQARRNEMVEEYVAEGIPRSAARSLANDMIDHVDFPDEVYRNGPHRLIVETDRRLPVEQILQHLDHLQTRHPARGPIRLSIVPSGVMAGDGGQTLIPAGIVNITDTMFDGWGSLVDQAMPAARSVEQWRYVMTHEWGHVADPHPDVDLHSGQDPTGLFDIWRSRMESKYAAGPGGQWREALAEMFAEWDLTHGQTASQAARAYATHYGWGT